MDRATGVPTDAARDLIDHAADAFFVHDDAGRFLDVNQRACELLGYRREELLDLALRDIEPDFDRHGILGRLQVLGPGHSLLVEGAPVRRDGSRVHVEVSVSLLSAGEPRRYVALVRDATERKQREEALRRELSDAREQVVRVERLATLGTLASGVGHELNNIAAVLGVAVSELRRAVDAGRAPPSHVIAHVEHAFNHVTVHARHLLTLGRPARDDGARIDVREVARATVALLRSAGRLGHVDVRLETEDVDMCAVASVTRLQQVLINLLCNADDAVAGAGDRRGAVVVSIALDAEAQNVVVGVEDDGPGIAERALGLVFEAYYTTKPPGRGTGLGLAVARQIVTAWGGQIAVASGPHGGTTVRFTLPRSLTDVRPAERSVDPSRPASSMPRSSS